MRTAEQRLLLLKQYEEEAVGKASALADTFVEVAGPFAADFIGEHVQSEVKLDYAHTSTLGTDGLRELKADLAGVQQTTPAATKKALKGLPWAFRSRGAAPPQHDQFSSAYSPLRRRTGGQPPDSVGDPLRLVLGDAGRILDNRGYPKARDWKKAGHYKYPYLLESPPDLSTSVSRSSRSMRNSTAR